MAKKIINAKLDINPSIAPFTKAESSRTKRRQNDAAGHYYAHSKQSDQWNAQTIPKMITLANHNKAVNNFSQLRRETWDYIQH